MKRHLEFLFGVIILFMMAAVLWKFIEPAPLTRVESQSLAEQLPESDQPQNPIDERLDTQDIPSTPMEDIPERVPVEPPSPNNQPVACTMDAKMCPDGTYVGRVGPNCEFAPCGEEPKDEQISCSSQSRDADACIAIVEPVCGLVQVQCVTTPCNPIPETFSNSCEACKNRNVISYTEGACTTRSDE